MNQNSTVKTVTYINSNSYETLNSIGSETKYVWFVFHGMGYLSKYFLKYFKTLPSKENYIICPQAPSKYYLKEDFKHVGASWLTKEETRESLVNVFSYLDAVWQSEAIGLDVKLIVFGYSQGVSIASRWVASRQIRCSQLVFYAGSIPNDLKKSDFAHLDQNTRVTYIYGNEDPYINADRALLEQQKINDLFGSKTKQIQFKGGHEIKIRLLENLIAQ